jgi:hypothetical protein
MKAGFNRVNLERSPTDTGKRAVPEIKIGS